MFRGNCPTRLDEKGRLKIPANFKHVIDKEYDGQFYITSTDGAVIKVYPRTAWEQFEAKVLNGAGSYQTQQKFMELTSYYGQMVEMDAQGRLTVADWLREKFRLAGDVYILGMTDHLEIRLKDELDQKMASAAVTLDEMDELMRPRN
jgi:MraZ protein